MYGKKCVRSLVRPESSGYFLFYFQLSDASFACIVVGGYCRIFQEIEYVIPAFDKPFAKLPETVLLMKKSGLQQSVKSVKPWFLLYDIIRAGVPFMYRFTQQVCHVP